MPGLARPQLDNQTFHNAACGLLTLSLNATVLLSAVLVSNFGGSTSGLLSLDGGRLAGRLKLDALYPVAGHKRCLDTQNGYGAHPPYFPIKSLLVATPKVHATSSSHTAISNSC